MIYLFHGSDVGKARAKAFAWVSAARAKAPDAAYIRLQGKEISEAALYDAIGSQGLFFSKSLILIDDPFSDSEAGETVLALLDELAKSENPVAILSPKLLAAQAKKLEAVATKVFKEEAVPKRARGFNGPLVNALAAKSGPLLWQEIQKAERQGDAPELVHGLLHWKARDMMQKGGTKWSKQEARALSVELIELVSRARSGDLPLSESLERFALTL
ncbi:hypothetical protein KJ819_00135 [Patescibacteria group bacterium]|nr:hypothetical protein [Patescibacteria group bacterium]MBU1500607.1 hypothetical protein [Patescibacteria group bacterium]MBU2080352.1 hypothetical protein [Patescibacteria group bacterium]MBU2124236.1 hypothetical protein [Patescibacteria group bacterium]MBU2194313.1 hypothetical protein [Patescibacteria group bacterium]